MRFSLILSGLLLAAACGGCGGHYTMTVGDHIGPAGQTAPVVARLQRNDFFVLDLPVKDAALRFRVVGSAERGAYTDKQGYAAASVPLPAKNGRYPLSVGHMDKEGLEVNVEAAMFVWDADRPAVVVDAESLPPASSAEAEAARTVLTRMAEQANIVYLTRRSVLAQAGVRWQIESGNYPIGPVLSWQQEEWHTSQDGPYGMTRIVAEPRLVSQLPQLRQMFPKLSLGIGASAAAARAFYSADMKSILVGRPHGECPEFTRVATWADLVAECPFHNAIANCQLPIAD